MPHGRKRGTKYGAPRYARMMRQIAEDPKTARELAASNGWSTNETRMALVQLRRMGIVHIAAWDYEQERSSGAARWKFGQGKDAAPREGAAPPVLRYLNSPRKSKPRIEMIAFAQAIRAMTGDSVTTKTLSGVTGWHASTSGHFIRTCRAVGLVFIADWGRHPGAGDYSPMYEVGIGMQDAPKPRALGRRKVKRRSAEGIKAKAMQLQILRALAANANIFTQAA